MNTQQTPRVIVLTGAAGGIGSVMTGALLAAGHAVAAVDASDESLHKLAGAPAVAASGARFLPFAADLTVEAQCEEAVAAARNRFGRVDAVINNVGIGPSSISAEAENKPPQIEEISTEVWDHFFAVNVRAAMLVTRAALPFMRAAKWGRIVNNTTSYVTMLRILPYGATKSALESMAAIWALQLKDSGITVNVLVPGGPTDTAFISQQSGWPRDKMLKPAIMGPPVAWLMSDEASDFSGRRITAAEWDVALPAAQAAQAASRPIGWPELATPPRWWPS
jgi:NAD(P)-dependent dehydrogenase (short-subunit alcohol dehydrogenase family)